MSHHLVRTGYAALVERINRFPQGAPPSDTLFKILSLLCREEEAALIARLPIRPFTAQKAARIWKMSETEARTILDGLAERAILLDMEKEGQQRYVLPPPMAGFFEFSLMRVRHDIDQNALSELFHQYLNVEEDFVKALFTEGETQLGRVFVHEPALHEEIELLVLDYERTSEVIKTASHRGISLCYCRHKAKHLGRNCEAPLDICMTFNASARSLVRHGHARSVDTAECLDLLAAAYDHGLVQFGSNVRSEVNFICNCCGCCCEAMIAARRFGHLHPVHTTNYLPVIQTDTCNGCGRCISACPVGALALIPAPDPRLPRKKRAILRETFCLGCGLCVRACPRQVIRLATREAQVIPPYNTAHLAVVMAVERGKLHELICDDQALASHRIMAAILGAILKLPPLKQTLASRQVKSRYIEALIRKFRI